MATPTSDAVCEDAEQPGWFTAGDEAWIAALATSPSSIFAVGTRQEYLDEMPFGDLLGMVAEFDSEGGLVAERSIRLPGTIAYAVAVAPSGSPVVVGQTMTDESGTFDDLVTHAFIGRGADPSAVGWATHLLPDQMNSARALAIGADGSLWVVGLLEHRTDQQQSFETVVARYDASGALLWMKSIDVGDGGASSIAVDEQGEAYLAGRSATGGFVAKLSSSGSLLWKRVGADQACAACDWVFEQGGTITVAGPDSSERNYALRVRQFDPEGEELGNFDVFVEDTLFQAMTMGGDGSIYLAGEAGASRSGSYAAAVVKVAADGQLLWMQHFSELSQQDAEAIAVDTQGRLWLGGNGERDDGDSAGFLIRVANF